MKPQKRLHKAIKRVRREFKKYAKWHVPLERILNKKGTASEEYLTDD